MKWRRLIRSVLSVKNELRLKRAVYRMTPVRHQSLATNVYHCCVHKTASQWIRVILSDPIVYRYSALAPYNYKSELAGGDKRPITERSFDVPFPERSIVTPLYIDYANYAAMPKPASYRGFFVQRDPRDVLVSSYFSAKFSHPDPSATLKQQRERLAPLQLSEGLRQRTDDLQNLFEAMGSWAGAAERDPTVLIVRYEDLIGDDAGSHFERLFLHCDIPLGRENIERLLKRYSFRRMSEGREQGQEDKSSKYRKGKAGDWMEYFTPEVQAHFDAVTGDVVSRLGYGSKADRAGGS